MLRSRPEYYCDVCGSRIDDDAHRKGVTLRTAFFANEDSAIQSPVRELKESLPVGDTIEIRSGWPDEMDDVSVTVRGDHVCNACHLSFEQAIVDVIRRRMLLRDATPKE
jgi:hypothetical protein